MRFRHHDDANSCIALVAFAPYSDSRSITLRHEVKPNKTKTLVVPFGLNTFAVNRDVVLNIN